MRIALVTESAFPDTDGATTTVKAVADGLVDRGHTVGLVAAGPGLSTYRSCPVLRVRPLEALGAQVRTALDALAPDVVVVVSPGATGRKALKQAQSVGVPSLVVEQSAVLDVAADYWRTRVAERADRVLVTSTWMVDRVAEFGVRATCWLPGVDTRAFTPALRDQWLHDSWAHARATTRAGRPPSVVVGYVGGLHKRHGVRRLADLAALPGLRLVVVGGGSQRRWLEARLPGAKLTGPLSRGDLAIALPTLDVLVHPGVHETTGHVLREAAASGVPVVAPRSGAATDVVAHGQSGLLYDPAPPRALAHTVAAVAGDRHRSLLGRRGRELAARRGWEDAVGELERHLSEVARETSTPVRVS